MNQDTEDEQIFAMIDMLQAGNAAILPTLDAAMTMEGALEDVCVRHKINAIFMRRETKDGQRITMKLL
jgi:hypothetical protein